MRRHFASAILLFGLVFLASPSYASSDLYVSTTGYVGINTTTPSYWLDALGSTTSNVGRVSSSSTEATNLLLNNTTTGGETWYVGTVGASNSFGETAGDFHFGLPGVGSYFTIGSGGNVTVPNDLTVTGTATLGNGSTAVTQTAGDSSTKIATDGFVNATALTLANGSTAVTQSAGDNSTKVATTAYADRAGSTGGGMTLLATVNASNASSVVFGSTYLTSTYDKYIIEYDSANGSSNTGVLVMQVSTNNGSTWQTTSYAGDQEGSGIALMKGHTVNLANHSGGHSTDFIMGTVKFSSPGISGTQSFQTIYTGVGDSATFESGTGTSAWLGGTINAVQIFSTGSQNIYGNFHLYGLSGI